MLCSYLFIPADKEKYINKINEVDSDYFVIDLEDSVSLNKKEDALKNVLNRDFEENTYFRIPFMDRIYDDKKLALLIQKSKGRIVVPKVRNLKDMEYLFSLFKKDSELDLILLVENPECLLNLKEILSKYKHFISSVGFGSHDFCSETGIKHKSIYLNPIKEHLNLIVKAFGLRMLDGVDVNIRDFKELKKECLIAFELGMEGKFYIHPAQLKVAKEVQYLSLEEIESIKNVYDKIKHLDKNEFDVMEIDGTVYEKPHLNRILKLINKI